MKIKNLTTIYFIASLLIIASALQAQPSKNIPALPQFQNGETIVFLGNSITRGGTYHTYVNLYYLTRFPDRNMKFVNTGVSGQTSADAIKRLYQDIMVHQPDKIVMMFGMNDANVGIDANEKEDVKAQALQERIDTYRTNMDAVSKLIMQEGVELIYIAPSIYEDKAKLDREIRYGGNKALGMCREVVYQLAEKYQKPVVDFYTIMNEVNERYQQEDPSFTVVSADRIHPLQEGHLLMGYQFLQTQNVPSTIFHAEIDAAKLEVHLAQNCKVSHLSSIKDQYFFAIKSNALPFPIEDNEASEWLPMHDELNQEVLVIKGLEKGTYVLFIEDKKIDEFSHDQLQTGINLADYHHTPQYKQAMMLRDLVFRQRALVSDRIRALSIFDFGMLSSLPRTASTDTIRTTFDRKLEQFRTKSYYSYLKKQSYKYMIYKSLTKETEEAIEQLSQAINVMNKPLTHMYVLKRIED